MTAFRSIDDLAARQGGVFACWQLVAAGWSRSRATYAGKGLRALHDGVWVTGVGPITLEQRCWAASLTAPRTVVSDTTAGAAYAMRSSRSRIVTVTRAGTCGPEQFGQLRVRYSQTLVGNVIRHNGMLITSPERTIIDLWPSLPSREAARMLRDGIRLGLTDVPKMVTALDRHRGRRGVGLLRTTLDPYVRLPLSRCRSDAEVEALLVLDAAGFVIPEVNRYWAGEEADFCWPERKKILEIDGPQFHLDPLENARKTGIWIRAGFTVDRISSNHVYHDPQMLLALLGA